MKLANGVSCNSIDEGLPGCFRLYELALAELAQHPNYAGVILASNWQKDHYYRVQELIDRLAPGNKETILAGQRVRYREHVPTIVVTSDSRQKANERARALMLDAPRLINDVLREHFSPQIGFIDTYELQANFLGEVIDRENKLLILDDSHVSLDGVKAFADVLRSQHPDFDFSNASWKSTGINPEKR